MRIRRSLVSATLGALMIAAVAGPVSAYSEKSPWGTRSLGTEYCLTETTSG